MENNENKPRNPKLRKAARTAGTLLSCVLVFFCFFCAARTVCGYFHHKSAHRGESKVYERLSDQIGQMWIDGRTVRTVDWTTKKPISPKLRWIRPSPWDPLAVFSDTDGNRGFLDTRTGRIVIPAKFWHAWIFSEGLAAVSSEDGRLGFIRADGSYAIEPDFYCDRSLDYVFHDGYCWVRTKKNGPFGVIDRTGRWIFDPVYTSVCPDVGRSFIVGLENGKYGLLDSTLRWTFPPEYDCISRDPNRADAVFLTRDCIKRLVTLDGEVLEPFVIDCICPLRYDEIEEEHPEPARFLWFRVNKKMGVMQARDGSIILPARFDDVEMASETMFECRIDDDYNHGILYDLQGRPLGEKIARSAAQTR